MILSFSITKVMILVGRGMDRVAIHTDEESPYPGVSKEPLTLDFEVAAGSGLTYVTKVLRVDDEYIEVINV